MSLFYFSVLIWNGPDLFVDSINMLWMTQYPGRYFCFLEFDILINLARKLSKPAKIKNTFSSKLGQDKFRYSKVWNLAEKGHFGDIYIFYPNWA